MSRRLNKNSYREDIQADLDDYDDEYNATENQQSLRQQLLHAIKAVNISLVKTILNKGVDLNYSADDRQESPLHLAAKSSLSRAEVELFELLVHFGASVHARDRFGIIPLHVACQTSSEYARMLLDTGSRVNCQDNAGRTPLFYACMSHCPDALTTVQYVLDRGANVHVRDEDGQTALHYICANNDQCETVRNEIVYKCLYAGLAVNDADHRDTTPLQLEMNNALKSSLASDVHLVLKTLIQGGGRLSHPNITWLKRLCGNLHLEDYYTTITWSSEMKAGIMSRIEVIDSIEILMPIHKDGVYSKLKCCACFTSVTVGLPWCPFKSLYERGKYSSRNANSLKYLSRNVIRCALRGKVFPGVEGLDLPRSLKNYILLKP